MKKNFFKSLLLALAVLVHMPGSAEDIDVFMGGTPSPTDLPNVLIIIDNTANWGQSFDAEKAALVSLFNGLEVNKFNVGLMLFTETGGANGNDDGGYVRAAMRKMDSTNKAAYAQLIGSFEKSTGTGDGSNGGKLSSAMAEAYLYFTGGAPMGGRKVKADYPHTLSGNTTGVRAANSVFALPGNALSSKEAASYNRAVPAGSCAKNFIIYLSNGVPNDPKSAMRQSRDVLVGAGAPDPDTNYIPINPTQSQDNISDEWADFLKKSSLGVTVYTLDINRDTQNQGLGWSALLKSMSDQSGGTYFDMKSDVDTGTQIQDAMRQIFSQIQSVNSVFASVSLPISANAQGTYLDQVFLGMFRPDGQSRPRWNGNLKQYKLAVSGSDIQLQGGDGQDAIKNTNTGYVSECAVSYWTPLTLDTEWSSKPSGDCLTVANSKVSNNPDGNIVEKGAQAYISRQSYNATPTARTVKTCNPADCSALVDFNSTYATQARLGAATTTERDLLISWASGKDKDDEDRDGSIADNRLSMHGDVVHSRPVAVNYGTAANPNVVVFYGANDGLLRAVNGNRANAIGGVRAGGELWSFMAPEFFHSIKRLRDNNPPIKFPSSASGVSDSDSKPYGIDGSITAYKGGGKVYVYAAMRRGGRSIYAFDVTTPSAPTLMWRIGCAASLSDDTGCTTGLSGIGQTWSSLKPMTAAGYGSGATPLLITGGGYDTCEDYDALSAGGANHNCTAASKGRAVYVLDAATGAVVKSFPTDRPVIADIAIVRQDHTFAKYGYVADMGGNVYRISFGTTLASNNSANWTITKIASLGCDTTAACTANRKFMFAPSVAPTSSTSYAIMLGSGDREKPLSYFASATAVSNFFFMFTDKPTTPNWPGIGDCGSQAIICKNSLFAITSSATPTPAQLREKKGWALALVAGEQVVTSALTLSGVVTFSTHQPPAPVTSGSCTPGLGISNVYNVGYSNARGANGADSRSELGVIGGLNASPVGGLVDGHLVCFTCGPRPLQPREASTGSTAAQPKGRQYWYLEK